MPTEGDIRFITIDGRSSALIITPDGRSWGLRVETANKIVEAAQEARQVVESREVAGRQFFELATGNDLCRMLPQPESHPSTFSLPPEAATTADDHRFIESQRRLAALTSRRNTRSITVSNSQRVLGRGRAR